MRLPLPSALDHLLAPARGHPVVVFDGTCVLCSASARTVLRHDRAGLFRLTTAQGPIGQALYRELGLRPDDPETMLLVADEAVFTHADAVLGIARGLGWPFRAAAVLWLLPTAWRDAGYRLLARNRFRWFGRRDTCWAPAPADRDRVL